MGMLQLILSIYERMDARFDPYKLKLEIIKNNIHGVDIEPMAVEISRLRAWLSIIVDEDIANHGQENGGVDPLPNLDFKFVCANSLILLDREYGMFDDPETENKMQEIRSKYFKTESDKVKLKMRREFDLLLSKINTLGASKKQQQLLTYHPFDTENSCIFFDPAFMFGVSAFNIIIANPPYVRVDDIDNSIKLAYKNNYTVATGKYDLYYLFFEKAFKLLSKDGYCIFITPNKFCAADSAFNLRKLMLQEISIKEIVSTSKLKVFDSASNYPVISSFVKSLDRTSSRILVKQVTEIEQLNKYLTPISYLTSAEELACLPNSVIPINTDQQCFDLIKKLYKQDLRFSDLISISEGLRIPTTSEVEEKNDFAIVKQFQFSRYSKISTANYISKENLAKVVTDSSERYKKITTAKILIAEDALRISATLDELKMVPQGGVYFGVANRPDIDLKFLLGILNSRLLSFVYEVLYSGMHMGGGYLRYRSKFLESLPVTHEVNVVENHEHLLITKNVELILRLANEDDYERSEEKKMDVQKAEKEIDDLVMGLYQLTEEEKRIVNVSHL